MSIKSQSLDLIKNLPEYGYMPGCLQCVSWDYDNDVYIIREFIMEDGSEFEDHTLNGDKFIEAAKKVLADALEKGQTEVYSGNKLSELEYWDLDGFQLILQTALFGEPVYG